MSEAIEICDADDLLLQARVEQFLYREADLLSRREFDTWLELFGEEAIYWLPASADQQDPTRHVSLIYDTREKLAERVWRLGSGLAYAQEPESVARHMVSDVRIMERDEESLKVQSALHVVEVRRGRQQSLAGLSTHELTRTDSGFLIDQKKVELIETVTYLGNLSILL